MKVKDLIKRFYLAIREDKKELQAKLYKKIIKKSLKHKKTQAIQ